MNKGFFITGTDTNVGKTLVTCSLLYILFQQKSRSIGVKPLATGAIHTQEGLKNDDALALQQWSYLKLPYAFINPVVFESPIAPHLAALQANQTLSVEDIFSCCPLLTQDYGQQVTLVEGVGGWKVPLNEKETMADFANRLNFPVILVVGLRLGCLSHAILTYESIVASGLKVAGWVANHTDNLFSNGEEVSETLCQRIKAPFIGRIPYQTTPHAVAVSRYLTKLEWLNLCS